MREASGPPVYQPGADHAGGGYRHLFGPVPSRRLGRSLGFDLVPFKVCSFDCTFCEVGRTNRHTLERREYVPTDEVLAELDAWLAAGHSADTLTLAGAGEPTLHSRFGDVLRGMAARTPLRRALLTNSSLLHLPAVRRDACEANLVKASLSAWDQASFERLNRPAPGLAFRQVIDGILALRQAFEGELWLEVFLVAGVNDAEDDVAQIAALAAAAGPDRVQLNTVVRPPADPGTRHVTAERLDALAGLFTPRAEVIAAFRADPGRVRQASEDDIVSMLARRPCTAADIAQAFSLPPDEVGRRLATLLEGERIVSRRVEDRVYYLATPRVTD